MIRKDSLSDYFTADNNKKNDKIIANNVDSDSSNFGKKPDLFCNILVFGIGMPLLTIMLIICIWSRPIMIDNMYHHRAQEFCQVVATSNDEKCIQYAYNAIKAAGEHKNR